MRIEEFTTNTLEAFIKAERYMNDGSPSGFSDINTTSIQTCPRSSLKSFSIHQIMFEQEVLIKDIGLAKKAQYGENTMFVHPDMISHKFLSGLNYNECDNIVVAPTASGRTVIALTDEPFFIKMAYPLCLGRLTRHMGFDKITSACEVTKHLIRAVETGKTNERFAFLREDYGRVAYFPLSPNNVLESDRVPDSNVQNGLYEWGVLFREFRPFPYIEKKECLIPFFALFGQEYDPIIKGKKAEQDEPLIIQLFKKQSNCNLEEFLLEKVLFPLFDTYFDALLFAGIELEAHAQNMLISIDCNHQISRIVCRDLESAGRDATLMDYIGLQYDKKTAYKYNVLSPKKEDQKYPKWQINHSFMFDFKLGEYIVSPLLARCKKYLTDTTTDKICKQIKQYNKKYIDKLPDNFFPPDWCDYANQNFEQDGGTREYIWHEIPKYR